MKQVNQKARAFGQKAKLCAQVAFIGVSSWLFYHALLPSQACGQGKGADSAQSAPQGRKVIREASITDSIARQANLLLGQRGLSMRAGKYVSSFRMPQSDTAVEVFDDKGAGITTLDANEIRMLRARSMKSITGSYVYFYFGGEWAHIFEKAQ